MTLSLSLISQTKNSKFLLGELIFRIKHVSYSRPITSKTSLCNHQIRFITSQKDKNEELITSLTGCNNKIVNEFLDSSQSNEIDSERITKVYNLLKGFGYKNEDIANYLCVFRGHPVTLKNYFMVLEEAGVDRAQISLSMLYRYRIFVKKTIKSLKANGMIKDDVVKSYASYAGLPISTWPSSLSDDSSLTEVQFYVLKSFIASKFELSEEKVDGILRIYNRIKNKSFRLTQEALAIIENDLGFTKEKILKHSYLLHCDPDNIRDMMRKIDNLGGISLSKVFSTNPKLLIYPVENIIKINNLLIERNMSNKAIAKVLNIFTLSPETVKNRLELLNTLPLSAHMLSHPAVLRFVLHHKKAEERLMTLKKLEMKCISLHILFSDKKVFERYTKNGEDRTRGDDIIFFLSKELSVDRTSIRANLKKHSYWYHVPLMHITDTLYYLYSKNFQQEEIINNVQILLYPKSVINNELLKLESQPNLESCKTSEGNLRTETILPLILYYIEHPYHFSGGGIWSTK